MQKLFLLIFLMCATPLSCMEPFVGANINPDFLLQDAVEHSDLQSTLTALKAGANPNTKIQVDDNEWVSCLEFALIEEESDICKALLDAGAELHSIDGVGSRMPPLIAASYPAGFFRPCHILCHARKDPIHAQPLIIYSRFYPKISREEIDRAQKRTRARIAALKDIPIPKVLCEQILFSTEDSCQDAYLTPLKMHSGKPQRAIYMPLSMIQLLIAHNAFTLEDVVTVLKEDKTRRITAILKEMQSHEHTYGPGDDLLDFRSVEKNYGYEIAVVIANDLLHQE